MACDPVTEAAPAAWLSLDGNLRAAAFPWTLALSDPRRQVSWLAGQGLMHAFPGDPSGWSESLEPVHLARRLQLQGQPRFRCAVRRAYRVPY
ncbi:hypothetical protein ATE71_08680 [Sphingopyxis sp. H115]|nr:hypothetical protein ATE71_08680 [Sphingopyxis sp. H115]